MSIKYFDESKFDYVTNTLDEELLNVPDGCDVEIFSSEALSTASKFATLNSEREHVTSWFTRADNKITWSHYVHKVSRPYYRLTIDNYCDYQLAKKCVESLPQNDGKGPSIDDIITFLDKNPTVADLNSHLQRNEGYLSL